MDTSTEFTAGATIDITRPGHDGKIDGIATYRVDTVQRDCDELTILVLQDQIATIGRSAETYRVTIGEYVAKLEMWRPDSSWVELWRADADALEDAGVDTYLEAITYLLTLADKILI